LNRLNPISQLSEVSCGIFNREGAPEADAGNLNMDILRHADAFDVGLIKEGGK